MSNKKLQNLLNSKIAPLALVTGGAGPLGSVICKHLAGAGYRVIVHYRRSGAKARRLAREIGAAGAMAADLTEPSEVRRLMKTIASKHGPLDVFVHTVGDFIYKPLLSTTTKEFQTALASNLRSPWECLKLVLPGMRKRGFGRVIVFGSTGCDELTNRPLTTLYYIAKTGLLMLVRALAKEEANHGITINMVSPGVLPSGVRPSKEVPTVPFDAVARTVLFLVSHESAHITGANLEVNGGWRPE